MAKITFIGAGSIVFARNSMCDVFSFPELQNTEIQSFINILNKLDQLF